MQTIQEYLQLLTQYKNQNAERYGIKSIGIFGSVARGEQHPGSDVDIVVDLKTPDVYYMVHIKDDLEQLFCVPVDVVRMRERMNPLLKRNIARDGVYA